MCKSQGLCFRYKHILKKISDHACRVVLKASFQENLDESVPSMANHPGLAVGSDGVDAKACANALRTTKFFSSCVLFLTIKFRLCICSFVCGSCIGSICRMGRIKNALRCSGVGPCRSSLATINSL